MSNQTPRFGFLEFAKTWNGRLAMLGFMIGVATELLTGQIILPQIGLRWITMRKNTTEDLLDKLASICPGR